MGREEGGIERPKHGVAFEEASTVFGDPLGLLMPDPDHSLNEERYLVLGMSKQRRLLVVAVAERPPSHPPDLSKAGHAIGAEAI